jgi:hypothetical protein
LFHSHLAVRHLIRELEIKGRPPRRATPPDWLRTLLCEAAEDFDPQADTARAGYECRLTEQGWEATLFLGANEIVGGARDGQLEAIGFQLDVQSLLRRFDRVDSLAWVVTPGPNDESPCSSRITLEGVACGEPLRLHVRSEPQPGMPAALRHHLDGRIEVT